VHNVYQYFLHLLLRRFGLYEAILSVSSAVLMNNLLIFFVAYYYLTEMYVNDTVLKKCKIIFTSK